MTISDQELLQEYTEGSEMAFTTLARRHVDLVISTSLNRLAADIGAGKFSSAQQVWKQCSAILEKIAPG